MSGSMLWRIMDLRTSHDARGFFWWKRFVERGRFMGVRVIHYKDNLFSIRIQDICQIFYFLCSVYCCPVFPYAYMVHSTKRLNKGKDTAGSITSIFGIRFLSSPGHMTHESRAPPNNWYGFSAIQTTRTAGL